MSLLVSSPFGAHTEVSLPGDYNREVVSKYAVLVLFEFLLSLATEAILASLLVSFTRDAAGTLSTSLSLDTEVTQRQSVPTFFGARLSLLSPKVASTLSPGHYSDYLVSSSNGLLVAIAFYPH